MKVSTKQRTTLLTTACIFSIAVIAIGVAWLSSASANQTTGARLSEGESKQVFYSRLREGLGSVQFATTKTSDKETVARSIESAASFIQDRSGLELSDSTKQKLASMELRTLTGESRPLTANGLADVLTVTAIQRLSALTDEEINEIVATLSHGDGEITLRASGAGSFTPSEFVDQVKAMRNLGSKGDESLERMIRAAVTAEISDRIKAYSEALPEQFSEAATVGLTPLQAVLLTYSVAADDLMAGTQGSLKVKMSVIQKVMEARGTKAAGTPEKAYGVNGYLFATPLHLVFDESTMAGLLELMDERSAK